MAYVGKPIGLRDLTVWKITKDDETGVEYEAGPKKLARAIKVSVEPKRVSSVLESDDSVEDKVELIAGYELTIDASQVDAEMRATLFGHKYDAKGGVMVRQNDTPPRFALAFRALLSKESGENKYIHVVFYNGSFAEMSENFETMKTDGITYQTHTGIKGSFSPLYDGRIMYVVRGDDKSVDAEKISKWFTTPQFENTATP